MNDWRERLRLAVDLSGKKHGMLAEDAGIAPETLSRILTDATTSPRFETVVRVTYAAGEHVGWILREPRALWSAGDAARLREFADFVRGRLPG